ncbi:GNAT family N-acetyltransferase [Parvularcula maris]|uniref:N-acetyltransferase n=1 Tax=Parvularcula maris TaxID=2965077 RepID=A0A9X2L787_9PROT|nr:N-acetyltransferase [Parvularcula maris]MCQ8184224.1 N-acetyltransferase [Parvularcula maris]
MSELDWEVRSFEPADTESVRSLLLERFETPAEADLTEKLRTGGHAEIELVADASGRIVGHIILSLMQSPARALGLGPVATAKGFEGQGIASSLIESSLALATAHDFQLAFLLGDPGFYERFGFSVDDATRFKSAYDGPYWQVAFLDEDAPKSGKAEYAAPFGELG